MSQRERLMDLLVCWQDELDQGRDVPATELGRNDPTLVPELEQRIADLRRLTRLAVELGHGTEPTASHLSTPGTADFTPAPAPAQVGAAVLPSVPGYEVLELLGQGGMGVVYKARDVALKRLVALKMLRYGSAAAPEQHARFRSEAEAVARLHHPHIVQIFQAGAWQAADGTAPLPFFAMEYIAGGTLAAVVRQGPQPPGDAARLVLLLARAVQAAHHAGVVHRDLKPANVLLAPPADEPALNTAWGCPKVSDFGLARLIEPGPDVGPTQTADGNILGTPAYMAPEQAEGRSQHIGPATDVWALGVILYELLAGRRPFAADSSMRTLQKICAEEPPPLRTLCPQVPATLAAIVRRCLRKPPAERYPSAAALADDLKRWLESEVRGMTPARRTPRWPLALALALAGVALLAVLAGAGVWLMSQQLNDPTRAVIAPPDRPPPAQPPPVVVQLPAALPPFKGWIDVLVSEPNNPRRQLLRLHDAGARPLRPGDEVRVEAALKGRPGYVYVLWIDAKGKVIPMYPWRDGDWSTRRTPEKLVSGTLILPEDGTIYPIEPSPEGVETLMMLVRATPLPADVELSGLLGDLGAQTGVDRAYVRWFEDGHLVTTEPDRSPGGRAVSRDPAERTQAQIRQRLGDRFAFSRAVSFFNLGKE